MAVGTDMFCNCIGTVAVAPAVEYGAYGGKVFGTDANGAGQMPPGHPLTRLGQVFVGHGAGQTATGHGAGQVAHAVTGGHPGCNRQSMKYTTPLQATMSGLRTFTLLTQRRGLPLRVPSATGVPASVPSVHSLRRSQDSKFP